MMTEDIPRLQRYAETSAYGLILVLYGVLHIAVLPFAVVLLIVSVPFYAIGRMFAERGKVCTKETDIGGL